ncbi:hypothetical protein D3C80_1855760 [compost metagenome]
MSTNKNAARETAAFFFEYPYQSRRSMIAEPHDRPTPKPLRATRRHCEPSTCFSSSNGMLDDTVLPVSTMSLTNFSRCFPSLKRWDTASTIAALP